MSVPEDKLGSLLGAGNAGSARQGIGGLLSGEQGQASQPQFTPLESPPAAGPAQEQPDPQLQSAWRQFFQGLKEQPERLDALVAFGSQLLQPQEVGGSTGAAFGKAAQAGLKALTQSRQQKVQNRLQERQVSARERGVESRAQARERRAERLEKALELDREKFSKTFGLDKRRLRIAEESAEGKDELKNLRGQLIQAKILSEARSLKQGNQLDISEGGLTNRLAASLFNKAMEANPEADRNEAFQQAAETALRIKESISETPQEEELRNSIVNAIAEDKASLQVLTQGDRSVSDIANSVLKESLPALRAGSSGSEEVVLNVGDTLQDSKITAIDRENQTLTVAPIEGSAEPRVIPLSKLQELAPNATLRLGQ